MNDPDILKLVKEQEDYLIKMRRYFHMNPELSNKEFETRKTIISELEKMGVEYRLAAGTAFRQGKCNLALAHCPINVYNIDGRLPIRLFPANPAGG